MTDGHDDRLLREALASEAERARPGSDAWTTIEARVTGGRARGRLLVGAAAAALAALMAATLAVTVWNGPDDQSVVIEPPPTDDTTTTTSPESTTTTETTADLPDEVIVDPIDMGPTPPTRDDRPDTIVAVLPDGWLVTVDTATGDVVERHLERGDLRDDSREGGPYGIWQVALSPDGTSAWYSFCCEPAAGSITRFSLDGDDEHGPDLQADNPWVTMTERWVTGAGAFGAEIRTVAGRVAEPQVRRWSTGDGWGLSAAVLTPDGRGLIVQPWNDPTSGDRSPLTLVLTGTVQRVDSDLMTVYDIVDDEPVELPSDRWTLPTFRRDGLLLVAEETDNGRWAPRLVDIDTFEVTDPGFGYGPGVPVMQRYDGSGEWLLVLVVDDPDAFPTIGRLLWFGPDGRSGTVPGEFVSAAW